MLAIVPQNSSGLRLISCGPGNTPWIISAASSNAMIALVGTPKVSTGTKQLIEAALLAASGPATPSMAPLPKRSGVLDDSPLDGIGQDRRNDRIAAGQQADHETDAAPAHDRHGTARSVFEHGNRLPMWVMTLRTLSRW